MKSYPSMRTALPISCSTRIPAAPISSESTPPISAVSAARFWATSSTAAAAQYGQKHRNVPETRHAPVSTSMPTASPSFTPPPAKLSPSALPSPPKSKTELTEHQHLTETACRQRGARGLHKRLVFRLLLVTVVHKKSARSILRADLTVCLGRITSSLRISDRTCQRDLQCRRASSYQCRMDEKC